MEPPKDRQDGGGFRILTFKDDDIESSYIAELVNLWINNEGIAAEDICFLVRQRSDLFTAVLKPVLTKYGIALRVQDALQDLLSEPLTKVILNALSVCCNPLRQPNGMN